MNDPPQTTADWQWGDEPSTDEWYPVMAQWDPAEGPSPGAAFGPCSTTADGRFICGVGPVQSSEEAALDWAYDHDA